MKPLVLGAVAKVMAPVLLLFSIVMLMRGHNAPGGGFIGGLLGAAAFVMLAIGWDFGKVQRRMRRTSARFLGWGLAISLASGLVGLLGGGAFLEGRWQHVQILELGLDVGTPLLFDLGVYLVVFGTALMLIFAAERA